MDDEVDVRDVEVDSPVRHPPLTNEDLSQLSLSAAEVLAHYGWYLLAVSFVVYLLIEPLRRRINRIISQYQNSHIQRDAAFIRQESMEATRKKMQEELDAKAVIFKEKQKQHEEEKLRQKIETWDSMQQGKTCRGTRTSEEASSSSSSSSSEVRKPKTDKKPLRSNDYSPLMGRGERSCSFRPGRRGPSAGG